MFCCFLLLMLLLFCFFCELLGGNEEQKKKVFIFKHLQMLIFFCASQRKLSRNIQKILINVFSMKMHFPMKKYFSSQNFYGFKVMFLQSSYSLWGIFFHELFFMCFFFQFSSSFLSTNITKNKVFFYFQVDGKLYFFHFTLKSNQNSANHSELFSPFYSASS